MAGVTPGRAFAATWRNESGDVVGTTFGGTMCFWPRKPWRIRIARDGFEHVIRCGECPGCLEFDRRRLAGRLHAKYGSTSVSHHLGAAAQDVVPTTAHRPPASQLFVVRIWAPIELHASIAHALHRRRGLQLEPGMWRLGASSFAILSREKTSLPGCLRSMGLKFRIEPLHLRRGRRAWRALTAGLIVAREMYGEQRNRWYAKGLPPADRKKWAVRKIGKYQSYDQSRSPRAWEGRRLVLVPPEVWQLSRTDRRSLRGQLLRAADPEGVRKVMGLVADAIRGASRAFHVSGAPKALLSKEQVVRSFKQLAERVEPRTFAPNPSGSLPPIFEVGGYLSSEHSQGELMPEQLDAIAIREAKRRRERKALWESLEIIERMRQKSQRGR